MNVTAPDGRTIVVRTAGAEGGTPILIHHGTPSSGVLYEPWVADAAARGALLIGYDRPGYGGSTRNAGRAIAAAAGDMRAIAAALEIDRLVTWGISGGGPHALACAALAPDLVLAAACLAGPAPYDADGLDWLAGQGEANVAEHGAALAGEAALRPGVEEETAGMLAAGVDGMKAALATLLSPLDAAVVERGAGDFLFETMEAGLRPSPDGWIDDDLAFVRPWGFELSAVRVPVLLVQGVHDRFVPVGHFDWLARHVPGAVARLEQGQGHLSLYETAVPDVHEWLLAA
jgi:pimeloyl-ACP methyl ester carboxylesterase